MSSRLLLLALPFLLLGCDSVGGFLDNDFYSVYRFTARDASGVMTDGEIALQFIPNDALPGPRGLWRGRWDLDTRPDARELEGAVHGRGSIEGEEFSGEPLELHFYADVPADDLGPPQVPLPFFLIGTFEDDGARFVGTWETRGGFTGGVLRTGSFEAVRTRRATEFVIAG